VEDCIVSKHKIVRRQVVPTFHEREDGSVERVVMPVDEVMRGEFMQQHESLPAHWRPALDETYRIAGHFIQPTQEA
jgi:hypothetical protein